MARPKIPRFFAAAAALLSLAGCATPWPDDQSSELRVGPPPTPKALFGRFNRSAGSTQTRPREVPAVGETDREEGAPCADNEIVPCTTLCATPGAKTCGPGGQLGSCRSLDGLCEAPSVKPRECEPGTRRACTTVCGSGGERVCDEGGRWGGCQPPAESCGNGRDDNCDGHVDEGCQVCNPGAQTPCATTCGSQGRKVCGSDGQWSTCQPPVEVCGNGIDDDCDGRVDEGCEVVRCEDTLGNGCNGDLGYGDCCGDECNTGGCSRDRFWAWCNRRNAAHPNIWDNFLRGWVAQRCNGTIRLIDSDGDGYFAYTCTNASGVTYSCTTPLVLSFTPDEPVRFEEGGGAFTLDPRLGEACFDRPRAATPWLAFDRDGSGAIEDGRELFGSATELRTGARARHGFEALAELDDNRDGRIDARDASWPFLLAWTDQNGDGVSQPEELTPVADLGLVAISLAYSVTPRCDLRGNCERERAGFVWSDGAEGVRQGAVIDVHLLAQLNSCNMNQ